MRYHYNVGTGIQKLRTKTTIALTILGLVVGGGGGLTMAILGTANAAPLSSDVDFGNYTNVPFTTADLSLYDRTAPSGGDSIVSFKGHSNVLELGVNSNNRSTGGSFYYYEGLQLPLTGQTTALRANLYVDSSWINNSVGVGLWGVGADQYGNVTAYPIVEFISSNGGYTGWRTFNDNTGVWTNEPNVDYRVGRWNSISMVFNPSSTLFNFYINGKSAGSNAATGSTHLSAIIFDNYNYGTGFTSYTVHWSDLATGQVEPANKDKCKDNGWQNITDNHSNSFKNQGGCESYVVTNGSNIGDDK